MKSSIRIAPLCLVLMAYAASFAPAQNAAGNDSATSPHDLRGLNTAYIDKNADPCQDFYQFACGKFTSLHPIPPDRSSFGSTTLMADENERILHSILDQAAAGGANRTPNEQKIGDYYASCLDTAAIDREGLKPLQPELDRIQALKSKDELAPLLAHDQLINVNAFLGFGEQQDFKDASKQIATVDQ